MKPEYQRVAIAEACGKWHSGWPHEYMNQADRLRHIPNYLNDLNAMREAAEKVLNENQKIDYSRHIGKLVMSHLPASRAAWMDFRLINATASQRAEAFLRTIGKWEEAKP